MIVLNCRSHFSLGESLLTPTQIVELYAAKGATALALTDTMRISGMAEFVSACKKHGVKPIIGARLRIVEALTHDKAAKRSNKPYFLRALVRTEAGYRALLKLLSLAYDDEHFYEVPRLTLGDVCDLLGSAGDAASIVLLGDFYGVHAAGKALDVVSALHAANVPVASEIVPLSLPHFARLAKEAIDLDYYENVPSVISLPALYEDAAHADSLDLMRAIASNLKLDGRSTRHAWRDWVPKDADDQEHLMMILSGALEDRYGKESSNGLSWA